MMMTTWPRFLSRLDSIERLLQQQTNGEGVRKEDSKFMVNLRNVIFVPHAVRTYTESIMILCVSHSKRNQDTMFLVMVSWIKKA